jgi:hypothetical protein
MNFTLVRKPTNKMMARITRKLKVKAAIRYVRALGLPFRISRRCNWVDRKCAARPMMNKTIRRMKIRLVTG